jgi:hypothetical protein
LVVFVSNGQTLVTVTVTLATPGVTVPAVPAVVTVGAPVTVNVVVLGVVATVHTPLSDGTELVPDSVTCWPTVRLWAALVVIVGLAPVAIAEMVEMVVLAVVATTPVAVDVLLENVATPVWVPSVTVPPAVATMGPVVVPAAAVMYRLPTVKQSTLTPSSPAMLTVRTLPLTVAVAGPRAPGFWLKVGAAAPPLAFVKVTDPAPGAAGVMVTVTVPPWDQ